jgi:hypothetical protein
LVGKKILAVILLVIERVEDWNAVEIAWIMVEIEDTTTIEGKAGPMGITSMGVMVTGYINKTRNFVEVLLVVIGRVTESKEEDISGKRTGIMFYTWNS